MRAIENRLSQIRDLMELGLLSRDFETILAMHFSRWIRPGDWVIDVGANVGVHLERFVSLAGSTGRVFAFEPLPDHYADLRQRFSAANVVVENFALSHMEGTSSFTHAEGSPGESGLRTRIFNNPDSARPTIITAQTRKLDQYLPQFDRVNFIKIDIEGGEIDCLKGSLGTIAAHRPVISVEYGRPSYSVYGNTTFTLFDLVASIDYVLYDIFMNRLADRQDWGVACDSIYWDYFMVPVEKECEFIERVRSGVNV
jgi:FkbM family methyltransferase